MTLARQIRKKILDPELVTRVNRSVQKFFSLKQREIFGRTRPLKVMQTIASRNAKKRDLDLRMKAGKIFIRRSIASQKGHQSIKRTIAIDRTKDIAIVEVIDVRKYPKYPRRSLEVNLKTFEVKPKFRFHGKKKRKKKR